MHRLPTSRREFIVGTTAALLSSRAVRAQRQSLTAQQIADRIRASVGVAWRSQTVDGFKAGDPSTAVTGIATTVMATIDTLKRAAAAGQNFIVTQEPTFYSANDEPGNRAKDPVYLAKKAIVDEHRLVIWRFSEHWNARQPNEAARALAAMLRWTGSEVADAPQTYRIPETTLSGLVAQLRSRIPIRGGLRLVGQPTMRVRTVFLAPGTTSLTTAVTGLQKADVILAGEPREWEAVPYTLDTWFAGQGKRLIAVGRIVSEEASTQACATWLLSILPEVRVETIPTADPYWSINA
jgi:putative NIF3 family GTP cyclohydrolase 1 type 2